MRKRLLTACVTAGALWLLGSGIWWTTARAQETKKITPTGFEFPTTMPLLKYHFPVKGSKATVYKGTWIAVTVGGLRPNFVIDSAEARIGSEPVAYFSLSKPKGDWPAGLYRLEIRADGKIVHTEDFIIR